MTLPLPFSILTALISIGLAIARFMKNGTKYFISVLAVIDIVLKVNWIMLLILLIQDGHYISGGIIGYCLFATLILNLLIWRPLYYKY